MQSHLSGTLRISAPKSRIEVAEVDIPMLHVSHDISIKDRQAIRVPSVYKSTKEETSNHECRNLFDTLILRVIIPI